MEALQSPPDGNRDHGSQMISLFWAPYPVMVGIVTARIAVRLRMKNLGIDDYLMVFALLVDTAGGIPYTIYVLKGGARHLFYIDPAQVPLLIKLNFISQPFGAFVATIGKMSVAFLVLRILGHQHFWRKVFIHTNIGIHLALTIISQIVTFAQCSPPRPLWDEMQSARCWNPKIAADLTIAQSAFGAWLDLLLAIIPTSIVWNLTMSKQTRLGLCALLSLGAVAGIFAALKTAHMKNYADRTDFTWAVYPIFMWAIGENVLIIIFGSFPPLKPIFDWWRTGKPIAPPGQNASHKSSPQRPAVGKGLIRETISGRSKWMSSFGLKVKKGTVGRASEEEDGVPLGDRKIMIQHSYEVDSERNNSFATETGLVRQIV